jgi:hypothetical protein
VRLNHRADENLIGFVCNAFWFTNIDLQWSKWMPWEQGKSISFVRCARD